ncbi:MAG: N-acetyltransferase [Clostridiales bacterium]|nr:N-acetyltransferase [Clostridiales bacterium]
MEFQITNGRIFSMDEHQELMAETTYVYTKDGEVDIDHTYVNPVLRGQGAAGKMMEVVAKHLRDSGLKATATCSYANAWLRKNRASYADIISDELSD